MSTWASDPPSPKSNDGGQRGRQTAQLSNEYRLDVESVRSSEQRIQSFAYVFDVLAVLTVVHTAREDALRIVSFRPASEEERSAYHGWLEEDFNGNQ